MRQDNYGVSFEVESHSFFVGQGVEVVSILSVGNSWSSVDNDVDCLEDSWVLDIDVWDNSKASSETDSGYVNSLQASLLLDKGKISQDIGGYWSPHILVGLLDFAVFAYVRIDDLVGIQDILPDV